LGRPFDQPVPIPTEFINAKPLPGRKPSDCIAAYYQCIPGTTACGNDGCSDERLRRGKFSVAPILTPRPGTATITPSTPSTGRTLCETRFGGVCSQGGSCGKCTGAGLAGSFNSQEFGCGQNEVCCGQNFDEACRTIPYTGSCPAPPNGNCNATCDVDKGEIAASNLTCGHSNYDICCVKSSFNNFPPPLPTQIPSSDDDQKSACKNQKEGFRYVGNKCFWCFGGSYFNDEGYQYYTLGPCSNIIPSPTPASKGRPDKAGSKLEVIPSIQSPAFASVNDWGKVQKLSVEGKYDAKQISLWVHEAAKYYYPGIKTKYCDPSKGECDFHL